VRCSRQKIESSGHAPPKLRGSSAGPIVTVGPQRCGADGTGGVMVFNPEGMRIGELSSGAWRAGMSRPRRPPAKLRRAIALLIERESPVQKISVFVREQINESVPVGAF